MPITASALPLGGNSPGRRGNGQGRKPTAAGARRADVISKRAISGTPRVSVYSAKAEI